MKKISMLILALLMAMSCFVACSDAKPTPEKPSGTTTAENEDDDSGTNYLAMLPQENLDRDFVLLCSDTKKDQYVSDEDIESGDVVSNAVFTRNARVEAYKGVRIIFNTQDDRWASGEIPYMTYIRANKMSGDHAYNAITLEQTYASRVAQEGNLYDLNSIQSFEYDQPWWHASFSENNTVYGKLYMLAGDISHKVLGTAWTVLYNKTVARTVGLDNFYDLVTNQQWTFENMMVAAKAVATENGDDSVYGLGLNRHALRMSALSFAISVCGRTDDGGYELTMMSNRTEQVYGSLYTAIHESNNAVFGDAQSDGQAQRVLIPMFTSNKMLFLMFSLEFLPDFKEVMSTTTDFGILPYPKYDENQKNYRTAIGNTGVYCGIPDDETDPDFSANMLNALGAAGKTYVYSAYYETTLKKGTAPDPESLEMLNIIRDSMYFDFAIVHAAALDNVYSKWGDSLLPAEGPAREAFSGIYVSIERNSGNALTNILKQYKGLAAEAETTGSKS